MEEPLYLCGMMNYMNMKTLVILAGVLGLVLVSLLAAHFTRPAKEESAVIPAPTLPAKDKITNEDAEYYRITASIPSEVPLKGTGGLKAVGVMESFVAATIADFKANSGLLTLTEEDIEMQGLGGERKYTLDISYDTYASPSTLSYVFVIYEDTMGAHPNAYYRTFTFDKQSDEELLISDLFFSSNYLEKLSEDSRTQIAERLGGDGVVTEYLESGTTPDAPNFQHFYLDEDELVIIFPPYQVGPWAIGTQEARFERSTLRDHLIPTYE
jgi:hypothetical protein